MVWFGFSPLSFLRAFKYRDRMTIIGEILKTVKESKGIKKKTQIMQSANLNYTQLDKYLRYLLHRGFLRITEKGEVQITEEGAKFLVYLEMQKATVYM